jgi:dolichol-phosphate mannosyltransferase
MSLVQWTPERRRFVRFCVVGGSGVLVNMAIFSIARIALDGMPELVRENCAVLAGFVVSCLTNFLINDRWTWGDRRESAGRTFLQRMIAYCLVALAAGAVQLAAFNALLPLLPSWAWRAHVANLVGIALGTIVNFIVNNRWTFRAQVEGDH